MFCILLDSSWFLLKIFETICQDLASNNSPERNHSWFPVIFHFRSCFCRFHGAFRITLRVWRGCWRTRIGLPLEVSFSTLTREWTSRMQTVPWPILGLPTLRRFFFFSSSRDSMVRERESWLFANVDQLEPPVWYQNLTSLHLTYISVPYSLNVFYKQIQLLDPKGRWLRPFGGATVSEYWLGLLPASVDRRTARAHRLLPGAGVAARCALGGGTWQKTTRDFLGRAKSVRRIRLMVKDQSLTKNSWTSIRTNCKSWRLNVQTSFCYVTNVGQF